MVYMKAVTVNPTKTSRTGSEPSKSPPYGGNKGTIVTTQIGRVLL